MISKEGINNITSMSFFYDLFNARIIYINVLKLKINVFEKKASSWIIDFHICYMNTTDIGLILNLLYKLY